MGSKCDSANSNSKNKENNNSNKVNPMKGQKEKMKIDKEKKKIQPWLPKKVPRKTEGHGSNEKIRKTCPKLVYEPTYVYDPEDPTWRPESPTWPGKVSSRSD